MPDRRIIDYHIGRLQDKSSSVRLKAINELGLLGDPGALDVLQEVFQNDPDPEVRKAAQDAGRIIFLKQRHQGV